MCTGFVYKGEDLIYGFNLDIDPEVWSYKIYKTKNYFTVGITVGSTTYFTHGVNSNGNFGNLPYMNGKEFVYPKGCKKQRLDLLVDKYIRGKILYEEILNIISTKTLVNIKTTTMHSLIGDRDGNILLLEPGYGTKIIKENFGVITNFPILTKLENYNNSFYGKDRYDIVTKVLSKASKNFSTNDALELLERVKQEGQWATRISFIYSKNNNAVYYCEDNKFKEIFTFKFE